MASVIPNNRKCGLFEYMNSIQLMAKLNYQLSFYELLALMVRCADSDNMARIEACWPDFVESLQERYNAPGGALNAEELRIVKQRMKVED